MTHVMKPFETISNVCEGEGPDEKEEIMDATL